MPVCLAGLPLLVNHWSSFNYAPQVTMTSNVCFLLIADLAIIAANVQYTIITSNVWFLLIAHLAIIAANCQSTIITSNV